MHILETIFRWFSGGDHQYMPSLHCMRYDWTWIIISSVLHLAVTAGYLLIAIDWNRNKKKTKDNAGKTALGRMVVIFCLCGLCGYMFVPIRFFWPAWRLMDIVLLVLLLFTWKYVFSSTGMQVIFHELDKTYRLENDLRLLNELVNTLPNIVWSATADGTIDYYNDGWYKFTGMPRNVFGDESWLGALHPDDQKRCLEAHYQAVKTSHAYELECRLRSKDSNTYRWFLRRMRPIKNEKGQVLRWCGTCSDIHEMKSLQKQVELERDSNLSRLTKLTENLLKGEVEKSDQGET